MRLLLLILGILFVSVPAFAEDGAPPATSLQARMGAAPASAAPAEPKPNLFAQEFYLPSNQRLQYKTTSVGGLVFIQTPDRSLNTQYSVVTDFGANAIKSRYVPNLNSLEDVQKYVKEKMQTADFNGVTIKRMPVSSGDGHEKMIYWVGHRAFESSQAAEAQITLSQTIVETQGGDFKQSVAEADKAFVPVQDELAETAATRAQFEKEEQVALKFMDQLDIGNELFGPFQGSPVGEKFVWQSFGETSFRLTNFESDNFNSQVGFWSNRFVFRGLRFPLNTIDPFIEVTAALESNSVGFKQNMLIYTGLEYRPLANNTFLTNYSPWGLHLLEFVKSYRMFVQYGTRHNLREDITGSKNHNLIAGVNIFYEWGVDLPPISDAAAPSTWQDYLRIYTWGEYFGSYTFDRTGFSFEDDFNAFIFNSSILLGATLPGIPLPQNPINEQFVLMPYVKFEHVNNSEFSYPFQNRFFVGGGVRWMPFRTYRWRDNEWLYKTKIFAEYLGVGSAYNTKQGSNDPTAPVDWDLRFGLNWSSRRF
jgi:hypothetical protein